MQATIRYMPGKVVFDIGNIFAAIAASDQAIFAAAETHKAAMLLEADPTTYNYSGGWPLAFGE